MEKTREAASETEKQQQQKFNKTTDKGRLTRQVRYVQLQVAEDLRDKNSYSSLAPESLSADECYAICGKKRKKERKCCIQP